MVLCCGFVGEMGVVGVGKFLWFWVCVLVWFTGCVLWCGWVLVCMYTHARAHTHTHTIHNHNRESMGKFRHEMGTKLGLRNEGFYGLW